MSHAAINTSAFSIQSNLKSLSIVLLSCIYSSVAMASGDEHAGNENALKDTLYQALNLALLLGVLFYFGRKPIAEFFATRRDGISSELNEAADLLKQAEQRNSELQRRLVDLGSEVEGIREDAGRRAEEEAERILADARATADRIRRDAQAAVAQELRRAQTQLHDEAADLAMEIAARKLTEQVGEADRDRLVDEFILRIEPTSTTSETKGTSR
jgi:F-type H+-transporting ATPase subunit b